MESFIRIITQHNVTIIYVLLGSILLLSVLLIGWQIFGKKSENSATSTADFSGIEETLKKILSQTNNAIQNVSDQQSSPVAASGEVATGSVANSAQVPADFLLELKTTDGAPISDLAGLKKELEVRASLIENLQKKVEDAKVSDSSNELLAKIKNLEAKLLEYEIIEDDIADLSLLKEENAKLKAELNSLKRGDAKLVDQFAAAVEAENPEESGEPAAAAELISETVDSFEAVDALADNSAAELEAAVAESAVLSGDEINETEEQLFAQEVQSESAQSIAAAEEKSEKTEVVAESVIASEAKDDIFGEFTGEEETSDDPLAALGDIDPDKMLDELKGLNSDIDTGVEALAEGPDIEKMADEAKNLEEG